ncbi:MAG TPA: L,D-transpeptidase family protein [Amycolatopsis sp.]|nr:L,D-transpeptidase family protein [Amycolatopsis sp.]
MSSVVLASLAGAGPAVAADPLPPLGGNDRPAPSEVSPVEGPESAKPGGGVPVIAAGAKGKTVKILQVRLQQVGVRDMPITGLYGKETVAQVKAFQRKIGFLRSGQVDQPTLAALESRTGHVGQIDLATGADRPFGARVPSSCLRGKVVCVDKRARTVRWIVDGKTRLRLDARFGSDETPTRDGVFAVTRKSRDHVSSLYHTSMPFALFFDGGQAVHYSPDFASRGYAGASHGCVNTRDYAAMKTLFGRAQLGDRVVVYRSQPPAEAPKSAKPTKPTKPAPGKSAG